MQHLLDMDMKAMEMHLVELVKNILAKSEIVLLLEGTVDVEELSQLNHAKQVLREFELEYDLAKTLYNKM